MSSKVYSAAVIGLDAELIEVEADTSNQLPAISIVGLPDKAVEESKERVRSAIKNSGVEFPRTKVTINLAPADVKKEGPAYDLPIAVSVLLVAQEINIPEEHEKQIFIGELALDGTLRPVPGIIAIALAAKFHGMSALYLPKQNAHEASLISGLTIYPLESLYQLIDHFRGGEKIVSYTLPEILLDNTVPADDEFDISYIHGQEQVKRALEIAAAGGHNILMSGPPGSGKTMLARAMAGILPEMTLAEALEVTKIYSVAGHLTRGGALMKRRPFRHPHHTASGVSLVGGGAHPRPGEITLAHRGVLFLDEFPEFPRSVLENLRQPLEDGVITVARASGTIQFPAQFNLVAAMNPCPCGYLHNSARSCVCSPTQIIKYQKRISGPLLDRIDLHIEVPKVEFEKMVGPATGESSAIVRKRVQAARECQLARLAKKRIYTNAEMNSQDIKMFCRIDASTQDLLKTAVTRMNLSARSYHRILKLARTIADLALSDAILLEHVAEALQYRPKVE